MFAFNKKLKLFFMKKLLLLLTAITLFSCGGSDDTTPVVPTSTNSIAYIRANVDGTALNYTMTSYLVSNYYMGFENGFQSDGFTRSYYYGSSLRPAGSAGIDNDISIDFENMIITNDESAETAAFYDAFDPVPTNFISSAQNDLHVKGISVSYTKAGVNYSTLAGSQSGSSMTITSSVSGIEAGGSAKIKTIIGTFNCKLYNFDTLEMITVTGGQFKIIVKE
jgi:hypothetical protein